jgi:hypothetical protein
VLFAACFFFLASFRGSFCVRVHVASCAMDCICGVRMLAAACVWGSHCFDGGVGEEGKKKHRQRGRQADRQTDRLKLMDGSGVASGPECVRRGEDADTGRDWVPCWRG